MQGERVRTVPHPLNRNSDTLTHASQNGSRLSRRLLEAQEEERKRISRELHDGTGQSLMVLRLQLAMLASNKDGEVTVKVQEAMKVLDQLIEDVRRIIGRLSPRVLEELGLVAAIRSEVREWSKRTGMEPQLELASDLGPIPHDIEVAIYRLLQEALHNIAKHSGAQNFKVKLEHKKEWLCLHVEDDGAGFSVSSNPHLQSHGLSGMRERSAALGGKVRVRSSKGAGTTISVSLPLRRAVPTRKSASLASDADTACAETTDPIPFAKRSAAARAR
ncbi:MAG: sensor histidine kinase [Acidobacteriota bacterium]|nr:sensor histidine kinase [Acidobacteriota bacterium]